MWFDSITQLHQDYHTVTTVCPSHGLRNHVRPGLTFESPLHSDRAGCQAKAVERFHGPASSWVMGNPRLHVYALPTFYSTSTAPASSAGKLSNPKDVFLVPDTCSCCENSVGVGPLSPNLSATPPRGRPRGGVKRFAISCLAASLVSRETLGVTSIITL